MSGRGRGGFSPGGRGRGGGRGGFGRGGGRGGGRYVPYNTNFFVRMVVFDD